MIVKALGLPSSNAEESAENKKVITYKEETQSNSRRMMVSKEFKGFQVDYLLYIEQVKSIFSNIIQTPNYTINTTELIEKMAPLRQA